MSKVKTTIELVNGDMIAMEDAVPQVESADKTVCLVNETEEVVSSDYEFHEVKRITVEFE